MNKETLVYYCTKHRNKNIKYNAKIIYNRKEEDFYLIKSHNKKCIKDKIIKLNNIVNIQKESYKLSEYKNNYLFHLQFFENDQDLVGN